MDLFDDELDHAVRAFQQRRGLLVDGIVGGATYRALKGSLLPARARTLAHHPVLRCTATMSQHCCKHACRIWVLHRIGRWVFRVANPQRSDVLPTRVRAGTGWHLRSGDFAVPVFPGLRVTGGSLHAIREEEHVRRSGPRLTGKRIIIDPGRGGGDRGLIVNGRRGPMSEADILWDLASRLEGRMAAIGMETFLSRPFNHSPSDAERAATANTVGADLMISLRFDRQSSPAAGGVASFYFGSAHGSVSTIGRNLADFIQREVVARSGLPDCRTHGRTWDLLRLTRMPTVQVDVGYITNPHDQAMVVTREGRDAIAEGILAAVKRLYLLGKNDRPTGTFTFAELLAHEQSVDQAARRSDARFGLQLPTGCTSTLSSRRSSAASTSAFQPSPLSSSSRNRGK